MTLSPSISRLPLIKFLIVLFVLAIALAGAVPGYFYNSWAWQKTPSISNVKQLKTVQKSGLSLPGWRTIEQKTVEIGGHKWSAQAILPETAATETEIETPQVTWLLLRPQTWEKDMPQIDWTDINGVQQWRTDSHKRLQFAVTPNQQPKDTVQVKARFFRGWTQKRTDAVLQWYAWADGGDSAPSHWFWADQLTQLQHRQRLAWVAVSIQIPIKPLGEIDTAQADAEALGQLVQSTLNTTVFH